MPGEIETSVLRVQIPQHKVARKPVQSSPRWVGLPPGLKDGKAPNGEGPYEDSPLSANTLVSGVTDLSLDYHASSASSPSPVQVPQTSLTGTTLASDGTAESLTSNPPEESNERSKLSKAWEEAKYFAGGLISHPSESTRHYSVLRHSHGLVLYQGPATSIAVSIFADRPLPPDRKLWLQQKGWTGKTGWRAKQLFGANGGWLDVTTSMEATPEQLPASSERAWQRDCKKFWEKEAHKKGHQLRETCIIRIPCEAEDGYFRIVVCGDGKEKKKLCPSPVFRVMSLSTAPSSIKGASLTALPLEAGLKLFTTLASNATVSAAQPLTSTLQKVASPYMPSFWQQQAVSAAYEMSGLESKIEDANGTYQSTRDTSYQHVGGVDDLVYEALDGAPMLGDPRGPQKPYPISMSSTIGSGSGKAGSKGTPTANLKYVREEVTMSLHGVYFGWARITPSKAVIKEAEAKQIEGFYPLWHPAIVKIAIAQDTPFTVAYGAKKMVSTYLINDFQDIDMTDSKIEVVVMGFLRQPTSPSKLGEDPQERLEQDSDNRIADIAITQASLSRPTWTIEAMYERKNKSPVGSPTEGEQPGKIKKLTKSMTEQYVSARQAAQRQVDRVPVHRLGVRRNVDVLKTQNLGTGGIYVRR